MTRLILFIGSIGAHLALAIGLGEIRIEKKREATAIEIAEVKKKAVEKPPEPPKIEATPPKPDNSPPRQRAAAPVPEAAPPPEAPASEQAFNDLPDFGLSLGGEGGGGLAVAQGKGPLSAKPSLPKAVKQLAPAPAPVAKDECAEPAGKPKPISVPQPAYSESARAAGIEGKVRVQLTVDEQGNVVDVKVLQGLGYGLDEAALAAAKSARFEPALRCGKPARATFNISMRFAAG